MCVNRCSTYALTLTGKYLRRGYTARIDHWNATLPRRTSHKLPACYEVGDQGDAEAGLRHFADGVGVIDAEGAVD